MIFLILLIPFFIFQNFYYLKNYSRLDLPFEQRKDHKFLDLVYYWSKFLFIIWLACVLFNLQSWSLWTILVVSFIRFPLYHISKVFAKFLIKMTPLINIVLLTLFMYQYFIG
jgi:hypothetical protein